MLSSWTCTYVFSIPRKAAFFPGCSKIKVAYFYNFILVKIYYYFTNLLVNQVLKFLHRFWLTIFPTSNYFWSIIHSNNSVSCIYKKTSIKELKKFFLSKLSIFESMQIKLFKKTYSPLLANSMLLILVVLAVPSITLKDDFRVKSDVW